MPANPSAEKSTNGRIWWLKVAEQLAPRWLEARALAAWKHPRRPKTVQEPKVTGGRKFEIDARGRPVTAWEWGEGPTVLLLHGWSGFAAQMQHLVPPLVGQGFQVVAVDLPAHGQSAGEQLTLPQLADAIGSLLWRLRPTAVIAHSFGAAALAHALREGVRPEKVVLVAPPVEMGMFARRAVEAAGLSTARADGMIALLEKEVGRPMRDFDLRSFVAELNLPSAVLVHDRRDREVPFALAQEVAEAWRGCQLLPTEGYGHLGHLKSIQFCEATALWVAGKTETLQFDRRAPSAALPTLVPNYDSAHDPGAASARR